MAYSYNKSSYNKRKYYKSNSKYSGGALVKRARGNIKASKRGTDQSNFTINFTYPFVLTSINKLVDGKPEKLGVQVLNVWDLLSRSPNFQNFQKMYDQCRIDYVRVKLNVTNSTLSTQDSAQTYDIYTAWDRTGVSFDDISLIEDIEQLGENKYSGIRVTVGDKISEMNGKIKMQLNPFQRWRQNLSIWPSNNSEKSQLVNTSEVKVWRTPLIVDSSINKQDLYYAFTDLTGTETTVSRDYLNANNPCIFVENAKYPFKPTLLVAAFKTGSVAGEISANQPIGVGTQIVMTAEFQVAMTFRGVKGAPAIS
jgi:hypothetical protein